MVTFSTQRGLPYDPGAAREMREAQEARRAALAAEETKTAEREARKQRAEELRAHGRALDEAAKAERRRVRVEIEDAYRERHKGESRISPMKPKFRSNKKRRKGR